MIESTEGFSVEVLGQTGLLYRERARSARIDSEVLSGPAGIVIYADSVKCWADGTAIDEQTARQIVENVRAAFRFRGLEIDVF
ncbi:MAG TPA: hypothetical protein VHE30_05355 [Polyangiaceae bacterium]|nr:hypothetical protein [Polyangiaceae bacterium]